MTTTASAPGGPITALVAPDRKSSSSRVTVLTPSALHLGRVSKGRLQEALAELSGGRAPEEVLETGGGCVPFAALRLAEMSPRRCELRLEHAEPGGDDLRETVVRFGSPEALAAAFEALRDRLGPDWEHGNGPQPLLVAAREPLRALKMLMVVPLALLYLFRCRNYRNSEPTRLIRTGKDLLWFLSWLFAAMVVAGLVLGETVTPEPWWAEAALAVGAGWGLWLVVSVVRRPQVSFLSKPLEPWPQR